jgi:hypothetical protein
VDTAVINHLPFVFSLFPLFFIFGSVWHVHIFGTHGCWKRKKELKRRKHVSDVTERKRDDDARRKENCRSTPM